MKLRSKAEQYIRHATRYLDEEGIAWQIEHGSKHGCIVAIVNGRKVSWYFPRSTCDRRAELNFKSQVKRSVERHRQLRPGEAP